jgi:hypothetical protein
MPYIRQTSRQELDHDITKLSGALQCELDVGEYNYVITRLIYDYINVKGLRYKHLNDVVGMLECCKQEFIRRVVSPYEDQKIKENGDV